MRQARASDIQNEVSTVFHWVCSSWDTIDEQLVSEAACGALFSEEVCDMVSIVTLC